MSYNGNGKQPEFLEQQEAYVRSPARFAKLAAQYFKKCVDEKIPVTLTGLMLHMGFASIQSFYDYAKKPEYAEVCGRAHLMVEHAYELRLMNPMCTGAIFALKKLGWSEQAAPPPTDNVDETANRIRQALRESDERSGIFG